MKYVLLIIAILILSLCILAAAEFEEESIVSHNASEFGIIYAPLQ